MGRDWTGLLSSRVRFYDALPHHYVGPLHGPIGARQAVSPTRRMVKWLEHRLSVNSRNVASLHFERVLCLVLMPLVGVEIAEVVDDWSAGFVLSRPRGNRQGTYRAIRI